MKTPADVRKVEHLLDDVAATAHGMSLRYDLAFQPELQAATRNEFARLSNAWQSFCKEVPCESTDTATPPM